MPAKCYVLGAGLLNSEADILKEGKWQTKQGVEPIVPKGRMNEMEKYRTGAWKERVGL